LGLDQDQVNKQDDKIVLDIFVGESLAVGALRETDSFPESSIVGFTVHGVQLLDGSAARDAYRHACLPRCDFISSDDAMRRKRR
jgi:hypothetical protein